MRREPYRLVSGGELLIWERPLDGDQDSRVEQICCSSAWFYAQMLPAKEDA